MGLISALGKMASHMTEKFDNLVNEEELDACISACVLVAAADGNISEEEKETAFNCIAGHESLKSFSRDKIRAKFKSDANLINSDRELATQVLEQKVSTVKNITARIRILGIVRQISMADGVLTKEEEAVINRIRQITA